MSTELLESALKLSVAERLQLVEEIWDSIATVSEAVPLTPAQLEQLDHRLAGIEANPDAGSPWEDVRVRLGQVFWRDGHE